VSEAARAANAKIAEKALRLRFLARVPFICECSDPHCRAFVLLLADEYADAGGGADAYVTLPGHAVTDAAPAERDGYWVHVASSR
jgi:hypothetical protein